MKQYYACYINTYNTYSTYTTCSEYLTKKFLNMDESLPYRGEGQLHMFLGSELFGACSARRVVHTVPYREKDCTFRITTLFNRRYCCLEKSDLVLYVSVLIPVTYHTDVWSKYQVILQ